MRLFITSLILIAVVAAHGAALRRTPGYSNSSKAQPTNLAGRWRVNFTLSGIGEKNLVFDSQAKGVGSFLPLDTGPENKPVLAPLPAVWSQAINNRVSFSGDVELPMGTCCRETGALIFRGKFASDDSIVGKVVFIGATEDAENFNGFRSSTGSFTAVRMPEK
jgi:hypothetical protein